MQELELNIKSEPPLTKWAKVVIKKSRDLGRSDDEIKKWIKLYAEERGYTSRQIMCVLIENGILPDPPRRTRPIIYRRYPKLTVCPKCVSIGKINVFYPQDKLSYVILHEQIGGTWGKEGRVPKYRRCYIYYNDTENCEYLKQQLEFYEKRDKSDLEKERQNDTV